MRAERSRLPIMLALGVGLLLGALWSRQQATPIRAGGIDRSGESILATGPILMQYDDATRAPIPLEAVYFLDYKGGRLMATVPTYRSVGTKSEIIDSFAERDLVADFKLDLDGGARPRFLMTPGSLGRYSAGWAPLYVFETTTCQLAVYKIQAAQTFGAGSRPQFELVDLKTYAKPPGGDARP